MPPKYHSQKSGTRKRFDLDDLRAQLQGIFQYFEGRGYFAECFGYDCADERPDQRWHGLAGRDIGAYVFAQTQRRDLYPIAPQGQHESNAPWRNVAPWAEDQVFDAIQFLASIVSKPMQTVPHDFYGHLHYQNFNHAAGLAEYREMMNGVLANYGDGAGWELGPEPDLEIRALTPSGLQPLVAEAPIESLDPNSRSRVRGAVDKFRARGATRADKRDAVTALAGILEMYKDETKDLFSNSTFSAVFNLLNNFGFRHNNDKQLTDYGEAELDAIFYHTLNLVQLLALKQEQRRRQQGLSLSTVTQR